MDESYLLWNVDTSYSKMCTFDILQGLVKYSRMGILTFRPDVPVLQGLNLEIKPGQYIALVGPSGCGKSTCVSLIERFYDPMAGQVIVDDIPISEYHIADYRKHISLVNQEPT